MKSDKKTEQLISDWLDGRLESSDAEALEIELSQSQDSRKLLIQLAHVDSALRDIAESELDCQYLQIAKQSEESRNWQIRRLAWSWGNRFLSVAVLVALLFIAFEFYTPPSALNQISVSNLIGRAIWLDDMTQNSTLIKAGDAMSGGTIELKDEFSRIGLDYEDGSSILAWGKSEFSMLRGAQKIISIDHGKFIVKKAQKDSAEIPMLIRTPTTEMWALDASFNITTYPSVTALIVFKGQVELKRSMDGSSVVAPAGYRSLVYTGNEEPLQVMSMNNTTYEWDADFERSLVWGVRQHEEPNRVILNSSVKESIQASPYKDPSSLPGKTPEIIEKIELLVMQRYPKRALLNLSSYFEVQGQINTQRDLIFEFTVYDPPTGSVKKFQAIEPAENLILTNSGAFDFRIPAGDFVDPLSPSLLPFKPSLIGQELISWRVYCRGLNSGLKLNFVSLKHSRNIQ